MSVAKQLQSAVQAVEAFARAYEPNREVHIRANSVATDVLPAPVRAACMHYYAAYNPGDDSYGMVHVFRQLPEDGELYIVIGNGFESGWGAVEVYGPTGDLLAAALFYRGMAVWADQSFVRHTVAAVDAPAAELLKPAQLEWIHYAPIHIVSVGGRFTVSVYDHNSPAATLSDRNTGAEHPCANTAEAMALAATLFAQP